MINLSASDVEFRDRVREWLSTSVDPEWREADRTTASFYAAEREWDRRLYEGGWAGLWWPREFGGLSGTPTQCFLFSRECAIADAPQGLNRLGRRLLGPILMSYGTQAQRSRFLPKILTGEEVWCQGFSEPGAGSDLASLSLRAEARSGGFLLNGQKLWTSHAPYSDWCFLLARTLEGSSGKDGISFLLVDLATPGITIRPIQQIDGISTLNEVFYDDVFVPTENVVGEIDQGWTVATSTLQHERGPEMSIMYFAQARRSIDRYVRDARAADRPGADPIRLGRVWGQAFAAQLNAYRLLGETGRGELANGNTSVLKLAATDAASKAANAALEWWCEDDSTTGLAFLDEYLSSRPMTIAAGSSEIQRDVIASRVLKLPSSR